MKNGIGKPLENKKGSQNKNGHQGKKIRGKSIYLSIEELGSRKAVLG